MKEIEINAKIVEAILIASDEALTQPKLNKVLDDGHKIDLKEIVEYLNEFYKKTNRSFFIMKVAGGFILATNKEYEKIIRKYIDKSGRIRLSYAALETLAIISYRQPITSPEIERIRGVNSSGVTGTLMERNLVTVKGRADSPGRPLLYVTTEDFLRYFGLNSSSDLPRLKELDEIIHSNDNRSQKQDENNPTSENKEETVNN
ncbi:MAG: SMC-Scp complex subunit ScpB [Candidatus Marinimicrobia bacterium]|nr:SMC-Scp complex subunit ScpB [Candidatus Neomarinimicrobiota bacterium]